jgi:hypothetical protein
MERLRNINGELLFSTKEIADEINHCNPTVGCALPTSERNINILIKERFQDDIDNFVIRTAHYETNDGDVIDTHFVTYKHVLWLIKGEDDSLQDDLFKYLKEIDNTINYYKEAVPK